MQELTYKIPFERLCKLGRTMNRRVFRGHWMLRWGLFFGYMACLLTYSFFATQLDVWLETRGVPGGSLLVIFAITSAFMIALIRLGKAQKRKARTRTNHDFLIRLTKEEDGLHFKTDEIAYVLKWRGINQLLLEPDGIVLSHANLGFFVPDQAFAGETDRKAFIHDIYLRLGDEARAKSEEEIGSLLAQAS